MASTADRASTRTRWTRRRRRRWRLPRGVVRWGGLGLIAVAVAAALVLAIRHHRDAPDPARAHDEIAQSLGRFQAGNISGARALAVKAVHDAPGWGQAHALLARFCLASGDGPAAEAQLNLATANGFPPERLHQLYAEAWLLEGDADRALAEADRALPRYAGYALRVRARALAAQGNLGAARATLEQQLADAPDEAQDWATLADLRRQSGDLGGALAAVAQALTLNDRSADALTLKGELVREQYGLAAALPWFDAALKLDPGDADAWLDKAATLGDLGRNQAMLDASRQALVARPGDPMAYYLQAVLAARAGNDDLAGELLDKTHGALDDMPGALLLGGVLDYRSGAIQQAIDKWQQLSDGAPFDLTAHRLLGAAQLRAGDADGALDTLRPLALRGDAGSYTLTLAARAFEQEGKRDWAAPLLDRAANPARALPTPFGTDDTLSTLAAAADAAPGDPVAGLGYIRGLVESGQLGMALGRAQALVQASPGAPDAQLALGDVLWTMNRLPDAAAAYQRAANLRFDEPTMLRLVDTLDRIGNRDAAQQALALFLSQNPADIPARRLAAHWQVAAGDWDAAIATLEGLRRSIGNRDAAILGELALAYTGAGDPDWATHYAAAAYRLAPMNPAVCDAYGEALAAAGNSDGARQLLVKAVSLAPGDAQIRAHLAALSS
jgi:tetratricopeptide (TPR) repeat protein